MRSVTDAVREPVVSGRFYESDPDELLAQIHDCYRHQLGIGDRRPEIGGRLQALVAPHAGYLFSGPVASWAFARLGLERPLPRRLLLLGPKHHWLGAEVAAAAADAWRTPLGEVRIDAALRTALIDAGAAVADDLAHAREHSLEVMLPFVQELARRLAPNGEAPSVVPVAIGHLPKAELARVGAAIGRVLADPAQSDVVTVISSDFSHETPRDVAYRIDGEALEVLASRSADHFYDLCERERRSICGVMPITAFLYASANWPLQVRKLTYATSMDVMEHPAGVGYAAVAFERRN